MKLIKPTIYYKDSYLSAIREFQKEERHTDLHITELEKNFSDYTTRLNNHAKGIDLPEGYVPESVFWLIDHYEYIGNVSIRHMLTDNLMKVGGHIGYEIRPSKRKQGYGKTILALVLPEVKKLGIKKALVTCDETNIGSQKIIEANGGILEDIRDAGEGKPRKLRYLIDLS